MSDGINLEKGARINLSKAAPGLKNVRIGLAWGENKFDTGADYDLDASVFLCSTKTGTPQLLSNKHLVYYGSLNSPDGAVHHHGDNLTGDAAGDDEEIDITLADVEAGIDEISLIVTIYQADQRKQNFGQIPGSAVTLYDSATGTVIAKYSLEDDFSTETAVQFGSLYRKDGEWMFKAVGAGFKKGLADFITVYGGNVA